MSLSAGAAGLSPSRTVLPHIYSTLTGCHSDLCPVCPKEGPVVKHFTVLEESHAGRVVLQGHFHHPGILRHCIRTDKKQLQLDTSGELITSWLLAASRLLVRGGLDTAGLLVRGGLVTTGLLVRGGLVTTGLLVRSGLDTTGMLVTSREHHRKKRLQLLLGRPSIDEKFPQIVLR